MTRDQIQGEHIVSPAGLEGPGAGLPVDLDFPSSEYFRKIVDLAPEGILLLDGERRISFINPWLASRWGTVPEECLGRRLTEFLSDAAREDSVERLEGCLEGQVEVAEVHFRWADGTPHRGLVAAAPLPGAGSPGGYVAVVTDLSMLEAGEKFRDTREFFTTVFNTIADNVVVIEPSSCRIVMANRAFFQGLGREETVVAGRSCFEVLHGKEVPCQEEGYFCPVQEAARLKRAVLSDKTFISQGQTRVYQIAAYPHLDPEGQVDLVVCLERDVTERRRTEQSLAFQSRELQKLQAQMEKLADISRAGLSHFTLPKYLHFLHETLIQVFPDTEAVFLVLDEAGNHLQSLEECPDHIIEPQKRLIRRLEKVGLLKAFLAYLAQIRDQQVVTCAERGTLAPYFKVISRIYPSWLGMPLLGQEKCLGFFLLGSSVPQGFSREDLNFFLAFLGQAAATLGPILSQAVPPAASPVLVPEKTKFGGIIGQSKRMQEVYELIDLVARTDATVLITGENGTGKELVARTIHRQSKRVRGPFVVANCSAYSPTLLESELFGHEKGAFTGAIRRKKGRFELAQEGTLFLDEIGDIPPATQVLLLRFLQDHCFERVGGELTIEADVRVVAATNKDLYREVQEGRFRDDLYYRLNVITIHLPPLRERKEDIPALSQHFLEKYNLKEHKRILRFSADAMQTLMDFDWPGNVRQLENAVSHAVILAQGEDIRRRHLPRFLKEGSEEALPTSLAETERLLILRVLKEVGWNKHEAARRLRVSRSTLYSKIRRYGLQRA
jgi:PAS domain S-box-containing protein